MQKMTSENDAAETTMLTAVVRGWGYEISHVVTVPLSSVVEAESLGVPFDALRTPLVARCGRRIRSSQPVVVIMAVGTPVRCELCRAFTGIEAQP